MTTTKLSPTGKVFERMEDATQANMATAVGDYPTIETINAADREQICRYWRFLPSPRTQAEVVAMNRISQRFTELGGFTPAISKKIGWNK